MSQAEMQDYLLELLDLAADSVRVDKRAKNPAT
jgi:hypothetical protein